MNSPNWFLWQISFKYRKFANIMICPLVSLQKELLIWFREPFTATVSPRGWGLMIGLLKKVGTTGGGELFAGFGVFLKGDLVRHNFWWRTTIFLSMFFFSRVEVSWGEIRNQNWCIERLVSCFWVVLGFRSFEVFYVFFSVVSGFVLNFVIKLSLQSSTSINLCA